MSAEDRLKLAIGDLVVKLQFQSARIEELEKKVEELEKAAPLAE